MSYRIKSINKDKFRGIFSRSRRRFLYLRAWGIARRVLYILAFAPAPLGWMSPPRRARRYSATCVSYAPIICAPLSVRILSRPLIVRFYRARTKSLLASRDYLPLRIYDYIS
nr:MAG TPA: hypothetical protein [Caudoviricetes sp.]